ncbi:PmoA family protein [Flavobacteriaceae bacterium]|nr:PmoA family protein [Flavobacteriaceae bacterium]
MKIIQFLCLVLWGFVQGNEQPCLCISVEDNKAIGVERPISVVLDEEKKDCWNQDMVLVKKTGAGMEAIPFQVDENEGNKIWFKHSSDSGIKTTYCFERKKEQTQRIQFGYQKENGDLKLKFEDQSLIHYRYKMKSPPEGIDKLYQKSGYIHPVISPKGDTLTRIQPPDHYHHYGVWGPWTRTRIDDVGVDFWNLKDGQGTVLFKSFNNINSGNVYGGFSSHQEHINLTPKNKPQLAINENLRVKVWKNNNPDQYFIDYTSNFSSPLENGILFEAYRYGGGLGFRFKEQWNKDNCEVITSSGKSRAAADGTSARWCIVYGDSSDGDGSSGVLFMSHPQNQSHPEPLRIWPLDANKVRGDMFFEFCPIRHKEWKIKPHQFYELNYRMLVFDGKITPEEAEKHWKAFAFQPLIKVVKK